MEMNQNTSNAKKILRSGDCTCVFCLDDIVIPCADKGLRPLLSRLERGERLEGYSAADRVVGKAPALLYVLLGIKEVYAPVMSKAAFLEFSRYGIHAFCDLAAEEIRNRENTGPCPMEEAVRNAASPEEAVPLLKKKIQEMMKQG